MELAINTCFLAASGSPEAHLRAIAEAGFTHVHWCHHWRTDFLYSSTNTRHSRPLLRHFPQQPPPQLCPLPRQHPQHLRLP